MRNFFGVLLAFVLPIALLAGSTKTKTINWGQWRVTVTRNFKISDGTKHLVTIWARGLKLNDFTHENGAGSSSGKTRDGKAAKVSYSFKKGVLVVDYQAASPKYSLHFIFPAAELAGKRIKLDNTFVNIPVKLGKHQYKKAKDYLFFPDEAYRRFALKLKACRFGNLRDFRNQQRYVFEVFILPDKNGRVKFELDFNVGVKAEKNNSSDRQRFKLEDDLRLGYSDYSLNMLRDPGFEAGFTNWAWGVAFKNNKGIFSSVTVSNLGITQIRKPKDDKHGWRIDSKGGIKGSKCAVFTASKSIKTKMLCSLPSLVETGKEYTVSFYAKTDTPGKDFSFFAQSGRQGKALGSKTYKLSQEWKRYSFTFKALNQFAQLCFGDKWWDNKKSDQFEGAKVWLDNVQLEVGPVARSFSQAPFLCASSTGMRNECIDLNAAKKQVEVLIINTSDKERKAKVTISVQDIYRKPLISKIIEKNFEPGQEEKVLLNLSRLKHRGILRIVMKCESGSFNETFFGRLVLYSKQSSPGKVVYAYKINQPEIQRLQDLKKLGIYGSLSFTGTLNPSTVKEMNDINWNHIFTVYRGRSCPVKVHYQKMTEEDWDKYDKWLGARISKYPDQILWKTVNEPNCGHYKWTPKDYVKAVSLIRKHVKKQNKDAKILSPDPYNASRHGRQWMERFFRAGGDKLIDVMAIHTYRARPETPDLDNAINEMQKLKKKFGLEHIPIMFTEGEAYVIYSVPSLGRSPFKGFAEWRIGLLSHDIGFSELAAASLITRTLLTCYKYSDIVKYYLSWRDDMFSGQPKVSLAALNYLFDSLGNSSFYKDFIIGEQTRTYLFKTDARAIAAIWSYDLKIDQGEAYPQKAEFKVPCKNWTLLDFMGNPYKRTVKDGKITFAVSGHPVYFSVPLANIKDLEKSLETGRIGDSGILAVEMKLRPTTNSKVRFELKNRLNRPVVGTIKLAVDGKTYLKNKIVLANKEQRNIFINAPKDKEKILKNSVVNALFEEENGNKCVFERKLSWFEVKPAKASIKVDGDSSDWKGVAGFKMDTRKAVIPDRKQKKEWKGIDDLSATLKMAYKADGLYFLVKVKDDSFEQNEPIKSAWKEDSLQIYIDLFANGGDKPGLGYDSNDQNIYVAKIKGKDIMYRDYTPEWQIAFVHQGIIKNGKCVIKRKDGFTVYEFMLPLKEIFPLKMKPGTTFGFGIIVNDADQGTKGRQSLVNTPPMTQPHGRPELWPMAILTDK